MKSDKYLKIILTIIAICLVWICVRDIEIGGNRLFAGDSSFGEQEVYVTGGELDVNITGTDLYAFQYAGPLEVEVNSPSPSPTPKEEKK